MIPRTLLVDLKGLTTTGVATKVERRAGCEMLRESQTRRVELVKSDLAASRAKFQFAVTGS